MIKARQKVKMPSYLEKKIPYEKCYESTGIIYLDGKYTKMYLVDEIDPQNVKDYDAQIASKKMEDLLESFPRDISFQFLVHNRLVDKKQYLSRLFYDPREYEGMEDIVESYDEVIMENFEIGHNNVRKVLYFVVSLKALTADDANVRFMELEKDIEDSFSKMYGITIKALSLNDRLKVMYQIYNPLGDKFGDIIRLSEDEKEMDLANLKYMKLSTKDLVAPSSMNTGVSLVDYGILNEKTDKPLYFRSFFINMVPEDISPSFVSDITNISSNMLFSTIYEPLDEEAGFNAAAKIVKEDTVITKKAKRDTVKDRKNHVTATVEELKRRTEEAYFTRQAVEMLKKVVASSGRAYNCTFVITLYSEELEMLDVDTELLNISAAKFDTSIRALDFMQDKGIMSCLPLGKSFVDAYRVLDTKRLSKLSPIGVADAVKKDGLFCGLNSINDTLILLNRKNNVNLSGIITGTEHSGKTYQMKREILNAVMGSDDRISIISRNNEYDSFVKRLGGTVKDFSVPDIFEIEKGYGLIGDDLESKRCYLDALFTSLNVGKDVLDEEAENIGLKVEAEVGKFIEDLRQSDELDMTEIYLKGKEKYPLISKGINAFHEKYDAEMDDNSGKVTVYKASDDSETLMLLDYLWNKGIKEKKQGISNWIFIDDADDILRTVEGAEFFVKFLTDTSDMQTITTFVIKDSLSLFNNPTKTTYLENAVTACGYVKLLNQGPIERKKFEEILNIPSALIPYVSSVSPGKGLIITPQSNIAFNDNFTEIYPDSDFKDIFHIPVKQRTIE